MSVEARRESGDVTISGVDTLDEAIESADRQIRAFVGDRAFVMWEAKSTPVTVATTADGTRIMLWDVEVSWRVIS